MTASTILQDQSNPLVVQLQPVVDLNDEQFFEFCQLNQELRIERTAQGEMVIMSPAGADTSGRNFNLVVQFGNWVEQDGRGLGFDSSGGFTLPNGAVRSPDLAWIRRDRWNQLTPEQQQGFPPIAPDFVLELRSPSDRLTVLQNKMNEYLQNGVQLGWLLNPQAHEINIYRPGQDVEILKNSSQVIATEPLAKFVLDLRQIW